MKKNIIITLILGLVAVVFLSLRNQPQTENATIIPSPNQNVSTQIVQNIKNLFIDDNTPQYRNGLIEPPKPKTLEEFLSGKTFWNGEYNDNRIYFADNQKAIVQFFNNKRQFKIGDTVSGSWSITNKQLCFDLKEAAENEICYSASIKYTEHGVPGYTDELILTSSNGTTKVYDRQAKGNLILDKQFSKLSVNQLQEMEHTRSLILYNNINHKRDFSRDISNLNNINKKYFDTLFKSVKSAPIAYLRFNKDGSYASILKGDYELYKNNPEALKSKVRHGEWWIVNNKYHCYGFDLNEAKINDRFAFCNIILPPTVMSEATNEFVTHSTHGFTMKHSIESFIPINQFSHSSIFTK